MPPKSELWTLAAAVSWINWRDEALALRHNRLGAAPALVEWWEEDLADIYATFPLSRLGFVSRTEMLAAWPPHEAAKQRGRPARLDKDNDELLRKSMALYILGLSSSILKRITERIGTRIDKNSGEEVGVYRTRAQLIDASAPSLAGVVQEHVLARIFGFEPPLPNEEVDDTCDYDDLDLGECSIETDSGTGAFSPAFQRVWWGKSVDRWRSFYDAALSRMKAAYASRGTATDRQRLAFLLCELADFLEPSLNGHLRFNIPKSHPEVLSLFTKESSLISDAGLLWERGPGFGQNKIILPDFEKLSSTKAQSERGLTKVSNRVKLLKPVRTIVRASGFHLLSYRAGDFRTAVRPDPEDWAPTSKWPIPIQIAQQYLDALADFQSVDGIEDRAGDQPPHAGIVAENLLPTLSPAELAEKQALLDRWRRGARRGKRAGTRNRHE